MPGMISPRQNKKEYICFVEIPQKCYRIETFLRYFCKDCPLSYKQDETKEKRMKQGGFILQRKYLMASHGHLASGMQSSINILAGKGEELKVIDAYVTDEDYTPQITAFLDSLQENEQGVIFTDFYGGSVNQKVAAEVVKSGKENVFVLANANLPLVLAVMLSPEEELTAETLKAMTAEAAPQLVPLVPEKKESAEEELDDFF